MQTGVPGRETVTYEVVYENGAEVDSRVLDVARTAEPVPEVIRRGTRLQSGMIGKLGTGSFIWPVPAYRHISRWANFTPGINYHRGADIAAPYGTEIYAADAGTVVGIYPPLELGQLREDRPRQRVPNAVRPPCRPRRCT